MVVYMPGVYLQGNGLQLRGVSEADTGIYACYLDNFVQPIVSYKFSLIVEGGFNAGIFPPDGLALHSLSLYIYI